MECDMYSEVVKREKRWKFFMLVGGVPICAGAIIAFWWYDVYGRRDHSPLWMKLGGTALLGYVIYQIVQAYFKFDKKIAEMKKRSARTPMTKWLRSLQSAGRSGISITSARTAS